MGASTAASLAVFTSGLLVGRVLAANPGRGTALLVAYLVSLVAVGQILPRALARRWPLQLLPLLLPPLKVAVALFSPLLYLGRLLSSRRGQSAPQPESTLQELLREGELEGVGKRTEIEIISGVAEFGGKRVRDVLTSREQIFAVDASQSFQAVAAAVAQAKYSRVPVYSGTLDNIVGMVYVFDILKDPAAEQLPLRPVAFASPNMTCKELLFRMLQERKHLAVVRDERGTVHGIVTLEDLLEELVGDIRDEHDEQVVSAAATVAAPPDRPTLSLQA
jgi:putative hemolysin